MTAGHGEEMRLTAGFRRVCHHAMNTIRVIWPNFVVAAGLVCVLALITWVIPYAPAAVVALLWAVLTFAMMLGTIYRIVIDKTYRQVRYRQDGLFARINNGRVISIVIGFIMSALCSAGLILNAPEWDVWEWGLVVVAIPLYLGVFALARKLVSKEYAAGYQLDRCLMWSYVIMGMILVALYVAMIFVVHATPTYSSAAEAVLAARNPLEDSSSVLISDIGKLLNFVDGIQAYGIAEAARASTGIASALMAFLFITTSFGIAGLLRTAFIDLNEMKRVFSPLPVEGRRFSGLFVNKIYAAVAVCMSVVLIVAFVFVDWWAAKASETQTYSAIERFVRNEMDLTVYVLDGKYYDQQKVDRVLRETKKKIAALSDGNKTVLTDLINKSFDKRLDNVDGYLDWYYSLPADYQRLLSMITGSTEEFVADQFTKKIEDGIDDSGIDKKLDEFTQQIDKYRAKAEKEIAACELGGVPSWIVETKENLGDDFLSDSFVSAKPLLDVAGRTAISGAAGFGAGVLTRAVAKPFFDKFVEQISSKLVSRAAGSAVGGAAGTGIAGPLGTAAGIAAGAAVGVGVDALLVNIDEWQHRDEYKAEIVQSIEDQRDAVLASLE